MHVFVQAKIDTLLELGTCCVHIFTDDVSYQQHYNERYRKEIAEGSVTFGFQVLSDKSFKIDEAINRHKGNIHQRETNLRGAVLDFFFMGLCDGFTGTTGSTVVHVVEWLKLKYGRLSLGQMDFNEVTRIGDWPTVDTPTKAFRDQVSELVKNSVTEFINTHEFNIGHEEAGVLDFLTTAHCQEIYSCIATHVNKSRDGVQAATFVKDVLLINVRVARLNRERFMKQKASNIEPRPGRDNWFKALINLKINTWASMNGKKRFEIAEGKIRFIVTKQDAATIVEVYDKDDSPAIGTTSRPSSTPESKPRYGISDPGEEPQYKKTSGSDKSPNLGPKLIYGSDVLAMI